MQPEARRVIQIYYFIITSILDDDLLFIALKDRKNRLHLKNGLQTQYIQNSLVKKLSTKMLPYL